MHTLMQLLPFLINALLFGTGLLAITAVVDRFFRVVVLRRLADDTDLILMLHKWVRNLQIVWDPSGLRLGWLGRIRRHGGTDPVILMRLCFEERRIVLGWSQSIMVVANLATSGGLLGAALALHQTASSPDVAATIGLGLHTTVCGLTVAIVAFMVDGVLCRRGRNFAEQVNRVLDLLIALQLDPEMNLPAAAHPEPQYKSNGAPPPPVISTDDREAESEAHRALKRRRAKPLRPDDADQDDNPRTSP